MTDDLRNVASMARLYREANGKIQSYRAAVSQGRDIQPAIDFANFILWSGIVPLCCAYARPTPKIDGAFLRWQAEELLRDARDWFANPKREATIKVNHLEAIDHKLNLIAGILSNANRRSDILP